MGITLKGGFGQITSNLEPIFQSYGIRTSRGNAGLRDFLTLSPKGFGAGDCHGVGENQRVGSP